MSITVSMDGNYDMSYVSLTEKTKPDCQEQGMKYFEDDPWFSSAVFEQEWREYQNRKQRVAVVIPTREEEEAIADLIKYCKPYADELLVVDGHSTDHTREIVEKLGCRAILDNGKGKGDAVRLALNSVKSEIIVFIDADYSHRPADIPRLVCPILRDEADHVVGARLKGGSDELHGTFSKFIRMLGSDIITLGVNLRFGTNLTESQNGFRAIRRDVALKLGLKENITTIEQEMTIKTLRHRYRLVEVPCHEYARRYGDSKIKVWKVAAKYVYTWLKFLVIG
ncbi:MAG: glycosyltransferase [Candidatus Lindowbacteria bacterium]|nr:glycosyltransferase [Candidatus Lindowbacteria bacterium]